jgi:hypothetical protein
MEYRSSLGAQTFPRLLHRWDDRSIGQFESRLQSRKRGGGENWSLRWLAGGRVCKRLPKSRVGGLRQKKAPTEAGAVWVFETGQPAYSLDGSLSSGGFSPGADSPQRKAPAAIGG